MTKKKTHTLDFVERAAQLADEFRKWTGFGDKALNGPIILDLVYAMANDDDLYEELNALVEGERKSFEREMKMKRFKVTLRRCAFQFAKTEVEAQEIADARALALSKTDLHWVTDDTDMHDAEAEEVKQGFSIWMEVEDNKGWLDKNGELSAIAYADVIEEKELSEVLEALLWESMKEVTIRRVS